MGLIIGMLFDILFMFPFKYWGFTVGPSIFIADKILYLLADDKDEEN